MNLSDRRTLILSLDGTTWDILTPLCQQGRLPVVSSLVEEGLSGRLESVTPPVTTAAWTSFQTGVQPAKHGVYTFHHVTEGGKSSTLVDATTPSYPTLWDYFDHHGLKSIILNLPVTYPADTVPGSVVSGLLAPGFNDDRATSSPRVRELVEDARPDYKVLRNPSNRYEPDDHPERFVEDMVANAESRIAVTKRLLDDRPDWDICMAHIQSTDVLQHPMWKYLDKSHPKYDPEVNELVTGFYEQVDELLGDIIATAKKYVKNLDIVLVSDHGFQRLDRKVFVDNWLNDLGYLRWQPPSAFERAMKRALKLAKSLDLLDIRHKLLAKETVSSLGETARSKSVDWDATTAWGHGNLYGYIYVHDKTKRAELKQSLKGLSDPKTDEPLVANVVDVHREWKKVNADAPHLVVVPTEGTTFETANSTHDNLVRSVDYKNDFHVGGHATDGVFAMVGDAIESGERLEDVSLIDIMPTILARHGLPIPENLDGTYIEPACEPPVEGGEPLSEGSSKESTADRESVEDRLENLGYME
jgi:predicted AlkP superfamily phosphohydrolase/phosphomutase